MPDTAQFTRRVLIVFAIGLTLLALWQTAKLLLLGFGGVILAVLLRGGGEALARYLPLTPRWGTVLVIVAALAAAVLGWWGLGDAVASQFGELRTRLPEAIEKARSWIQDNRLASSMLPADGLTVDEGWLERVLGAASATFGAVINVAAVVLVALYLSLNPAPYRRGVLALTPPRLRAEVGEGLRRAEWALHRWLLGQLTAMTTVGILTGVGLYLIDVPLAFILGLVAGLLDFVPIVGPFAAAVPGVLLAFTQSPADALYAAAVYFAVQQVEGGVITPLAQRWAVSLPPVLGLLAIAVFGSLFGLVGILFATPSVVVIMVLVQHFYTERLPPISAEEERGGRPGSGD